MPSKKKVETKELAPAMPKSEIVPFDELQRQLRMPFDEQKKLITSQSPLTDSAVRMVLEVARVIGVPLQGINVIPTKLGVMPYINSIGIRYKYHTDKRGFKSATAEIIQTPKQKGDLAIVKGRVEFMDGSFGENIGAVIVETDDTKGWNVANALMKAATKAIRRAGQDAVEITLPVYEDYIEYREEQMKDITPGMELANGNGKYIDNPATLMQFTRNLELAKILIADACEKLGVEMLGEIGNFAEAWEKVKPQNGASE